MRRVAFILVAALFSMAENNAAAESGLVTVRPTALYDSHSERARPVWILSGGHPARKLTSVTGWHKVETHRPQITGWVRAAETRPGNWMVVISERAAMKIEPAPDAPDAAVVPRGAILESLSPVPFCGAAGGTGADSGAGGSAAGGSGRRCWHHVAHPDGETGHIRAGDVWRNF